MIAFLENWYKLCEESFCEVSYVFSMVQDFGMDVKYDYTSQTPMIPLKDSFTLDIFNPHHINTCIRDHT
jgi:hypothetical protein